MNTIDKFHKIEIDESLFEYSTPEVSQVWDIFRVRIFNELFLNDKNSDVPIRVTPKQIFKHLINNICNLNKLLRNKNSVFFIYSRDIDDQGFWYDKISNDLLHTIDEKHRVVIELNLCAGKSKFPKFYIIILPFFCSLFKKASNLPIDFYNKISQIFNNNEFTYSIADAIYKRFQISKYVYYLLLKILKPKKVIISCDTRKYIILPAKELNIVTYEMQHAGIVYEYPSYSYPVGINFKSNIIFADYYLKLGEIWGKGMNIPSKSIVIGNSFLSDKVAVKDSFISDIVFVSTVVHRKVLMELCKNFALNNKDKNIVYKLHPEEWNMKGDTSYYFADMNNVTIVTNEIPMRSLILGTDVVALVYSSAFYEALTLGKKVAVARYENYFIYRDYLNFTNVYTFAHASELDYILQKNSIMCSESFFAPYNKDIAEQIFK